ncbi:hypothetical protein KNP414_05294 [Paenibacillus mucilaginosus KNP414]|uniref:Knr4/Smi1-like domain-containing protein n=2 Tax=Paenibacillus mucilaginosus TaxID=61624 RepID=F8FE59_PAEMK|nr:hypothetical protein KNP414_05294 [Paenibacillus mucilaginosus KNP414]
MGEMTSNSLDKETEDQMDDVGLYAMLSLIVPIAVIIVIIIGKMLRHQEIPDSRYTPFDQITGHAPVVFQEHKETKEDEDEAGDDKDKNEREGCCVLEGDGLYRKLLDEGIAGPQEIRGCSEEELRNFEMENNLRLPGSYRNFLLTAGHGAGRLLHGTDILWDQVTSLREAAEELLAENDESFTLPEDAFVFSMHQGYAFMYFLLSDGENPAVYMYVEGSGVPRKAYSSFDSFLLEELNLHSERQNGKSETA